VRELRIGDDSDGVRRRLPKTAFKGEGGALGIHVRREIRNPGCGGNLNQRKCINFADPEDLVSVIWCLDEAVWIQVKTIDSGTQ